MSNRLEKFIRENREEFDSASPQQGGWEKLRETMQPVPKKTTIFSIHYIKWVAAVAVLFFAILIYDGVKQARHDTKIATAESKPVLPKEVSEAIDPAYAKEVAQFSRLIQAKQKELKQVAQQHPALYQQFRQEVERLDSIYLSLQTDLTDYPNQDQLLEAVIQNLELQLNLLNRQLQIARQLKNTTYESKNI